MKARVGVDDAIDDAHRLLNEALDAYRRQRHQQTSLVRTDQVLGIMRQAMAAAPASPVRITCGHLSEVASLTGADPMEFLRQVVLDRGHELELLQHDVAAFDESDQLRLRTLAAAGAEVRLLPRRFPSTVVVGSELGLLRAAPSGRPRHHEHHGHSGQQGQHRQQVMLVRSTQTVAALRQVHNGLRDLALDFAPLSETVETMRRSEQLVEVLGKLCSGMKDETAARQMRISVRTYRRHVASILKALEVSSRFEAGVRVSELGLTKLLWRKPTPTRLSATA